MTSPLTLTFTDEQGVEYSLAEGPEPGEAMTPRTRSLAIALLSTALDELTGEGDDHDGEKPTPPEPEVQSRVRFASDPG